MNSQYNKTAYTAHEISPETRESVTKTIGRLLDENSENLVDATDFYAKGYHDALVDVLNAFHIQHQEQYFD